MQSSPGLTTSLRDRVLTRLGFDTAPAPDLAGLGALYAAWCARVPFDNVRKMIALRTPGAALPGITAEDFFEEWMRHGAGGTCWPSSHALCGLLASCGFDARRVVASMRDTGTGSHGTVKVRVEGRDVDLTDQEFRLLYLLASHAGIVFSREALLAKIWRGDTFVTVRSVDTLVKRLRRRIEPSPAEPRFLLTVWGVGYKFADV